MKDAPSSISEICMQGEVFKFGFYCYFLLFCDFSNMKFDKIQK